MPKRSLNLGNPDPKKVEQLNRAIDALMAATDGKPPRAPAGMAPLLKIAGELRQMPRESFKARLKSEFEGRPPMSTVAEPVATVHAKATPRIAFKNTAKAIDFYKHALGAKEQFRFAVGDKIPQAVLQIGDSTIMVCDEWPEGGRFSAETLGNSPVWMVIEVDNVDSFAEHAVSAGMTLVRKVQDQFYGHRDVLLKDPFGYTWSAYTVKEHMSVEEMHRRMANMTHGPEGGRMPQSEQKRVNPIREGFRTLTPYLVAGNAPAVIDFVKQTFGGEELFRAVGSAGGYHCEMRVEDSMLMIGGGGEGVSWKGDAKPGAFHVYVRDCDAAYERALQAGGKSLHAPTDQPYGERSATVIDSEGNFWYIATYLKGGYKWEGAPTIQPCLHPLRAEPVINFLKRAFNAEEIGRHASPEGVIQHATVKVGTSYIELGEAHGPYQPMKSMFYLYVPSVDEVFRTAIAAGGKSLQEPADQPYGDRVGAIEDSFGNQWWIASHVKDLR